MNKENKMQMHPHMKNVAAASMPTKGRQQPQGSNSELPEIGHKFSSWTKEDQNLSELDELLMDHDLLNEAPAGSKSQIRNGGMISAQIHVTRG